MMRRMPLGFRIAGPVGGGRALVDLDRALAAYAACGPAAEVGQEAYLSAFHFGADFRAHLAEHGTPGGFAGACYAPWLWADLDGDPDDLGPVLDQARALASFAGERYGLDGDDLIVFFTGYKGFCLGLPAPAVALPSVLFHRIARAFMEELAARVNVRIDPLMFTKVQPHRAPNSRHPRSGRHKIRLDADELLHLSLDRILELAREPRPFDWYQRTTTHPQASADWETARRFLEQAEANRPKRSSSAGDQPRLNRQTLAFLRDGADQGDRHRLLFSAAANLGEFGCSFELAYALLAPAALDCELPPGEVTRQIRCGLDHAARQCSQSKSDATQEERALSEAQDVQDEEDDDGRDGDVRDGG